MASEKTKGFLPGTFTSHLTLGVILGIACGLFLGQSCSRLSWIGNAYVGLLQMAVLPYVTLSLVANIGRLSWREGGRLAKIGIRVQLVLWTIGLLALLGMTFAFPARHVGSFYSTSLVDEVQRPDWLEMFIPSNPFWSLTYSLVPAVVVFSLGCGVALIGVRNKAVLLDPLDVAVEGLSRLNKMVVRLSPVGIFAIVASAAGTLSPAQFGLLQGYLMIFGLAAVLLSLWLLPALVANCTPFSKRDVLSASRDVLIAAFVIGNTFVVLPLIIDSVKRLFQKHQLEAEQAHTPEFVVPLAYPFPDVGRIVGLLFIPFAAWFYGTSIDVDQYPGLLGVGLVGAFSKPVVTVPLLLEIAELPSDVFHLYLSMGVVASRFGDLMKSMHLIVFAILTSCTLAGAFRIRWKRLLIGGTGSLMLSVLLILACRWLLAVAFAGTGGQENLLLDRPLVGPQVEITWPTAGSANPDPLREGETHLDRIRRRGLIRIGYHPDKVPFSYSSSDGELIGFDIDMAHQLARDLNVGIEFVPFSEDVARGLLQDHYDVAMGGIEGTIKQATVIPHGTPYMDLSAALVVSDHRRGEFRTLDQILARDDLRLAVVSDSLTSELLASRLPGARVVELESEAMYFEGGGRVADALATSLEAGSAWTLLYPGYAVVRPEGTKLRVPLYYLTPPGDNILEDFMETWLTLKQRDGTIDELYEYWILGKDSAAAEPRWCIIRDVLHWVD